MKRGIICHLAVTHTHTQSCRKRWAHHPRCHGHFNDSDASFVALKAEKSSVVEERWYDNRVLQRCRTLTMYWSVAARLHRPYICRGQCCICFMRPLVTISPWWQSARSTAVKYSHHTERQKNVFSYLPPTFRTISVGLRAISWTFGDVCLLLFKDQKCTIKTNPLRQPTVDGKILRDDWFWRPCGGRKKRFSFHSCY